MRKLIVLLLLLPFLATGCFDYQELNNRAVIAGIAIDYNQDKFEVTFEILNNKKSSSEKENSDKTYTVEGEGTTLPEAFQDCSLKISKDPYYAHLKVLILGEEVTQEKMLDVLDYFIRDASIRNIFLPIIAEDSSAKDILKSTTTENPVVSTSIQSMLENNKMNNGVVVVKDFENFLNAIIDPYQDAYLNTISKEEDTLVLNGIAAFEGDKLKTILSAEESLAFNALNNDSTIYYVSAVCPNDSSQSITINLYDNTGTEYSFENDEIQVKSNLKASIITDGCKFDLRDPEVYTTISEIFTPVIKQQFQDTIEVIKKNQTDILGINNRYYKKNKTSLEDWYTKNFTFDVELNVNKNGLIFEVNEND